MKDLEGCQYGICCHNDEYQELKKELSQLQQEKEELLNKIEKLEEELEARAEVIKRQAHELTQLQQENIKLKKEITYQNIVFAQFQQTKNENIFLQQEKEELIKFLEEKIAYCKENIYEYKRVNDENLQIKLWETSEEDYQEILSKLKESDKNE